MECLVSGYLKVSAWALASILIAAMAQSFVIATRNVNPNTNPNYPAPTCPPGWKMIHQWNYTEVGGGNSNRMGFNYVSNAVCSSP
jgi:hypothetical protein